MEVRGGKFFDEISGIELQQRATGNAKEGIGKASNSDFI